jgi:polysaccharide export outer membrane protein
MTGVPRNAAAAAIAFVLAATVSACRHASDFIWVDQVPKTMAAPQDTGQIAPGDVIGVRVWNQEANSMERARVREDGRISMPLLNDVEVAGMEPAELAQRLQVKLKTYIVNPLVTVVVHERRPLRVSVLGQVAHPGIYELERGSGVLHALAAAGGVTPFAQDDGIFVLRSGYWADNASPMRVRFRYRDLRGGKVPAVSLCLRPGDVVVVE